MDPSWGTQFWEGATRPFVNIMSALGITPRQITKRHDRSIEGLPDRWTNCRPPSTRGVSALHVGTIARVKYSVASGPPSRPTLSHSSIERFADHVLSPG